MAGETSELKGGYFTYCQGCKHDGDCELKHHEYVGAPSADQVVDVGYPGHERLDWAFSSAQQNGGVTDLAKARAMCNGRIHETGSMFYPLACVCGTVINSLTFNSIMGGGFCAKFDPNQKAEERIAQAKAIARKRHISFAKAARLLPEPEENYKAVMEY